MDQRETRNENIKINKRRMLSEGAKLGHHQFQSHTDHRRRDDEVDEADRARLVPHPQTLLVRR